MAENIPAKIVKIFPVHAMKAPRGSRSMAPLILKLDAKMSA